MGAVVIAMACRGTSEDRLAGVVEREEESAFAIVAGQSRGEC